MGHVHSDPNSACDMSCIEEDQPAMTDAKGGEVARYEVDAPPDCIHIDEEGPFVLYAKYAALAERLNKAENELCTAKDQLPPDETDLSVGLIKLKDRLKACEEDKAWFEEFACSCNVPDYICQAHSERDETNTTLFKDRIQAVAAERDQLQAALEELKLRLKMEAECHEQTVADLQRARAEVERLAPYRSDHQLEQSNARLKAALVKERGCEECWKGQSCGTDCHMNDIALTETP